MAFIFDANIENSEKSDTEITHNLIDNTSKHPSLPYAKILGSGFSDIRRKKQVIDHQML